MFQEWLEIVNLSSLNAGMEEEVFSNLTRAAEENGHFKIYLADDMPKRWHSSFPPRNGPIMALADSGYGFLNMWFGPANHERESLFNCIRSMMNIIPNHLLS